MSVEIIDVRAGASHSTPPHHIIVSEFRFFVFGTHWSLPMGLPSQQTDLCLGFFLGSIIHVLSRSFTEELAIRQLLPGEP